MLEIPTLPRMCAYSGRRSVLQAALAAARRAALQSIASVLVTHFDHGQLLYTHAPSAEAPRASGLSNVNTEALATFDYAHEIGTAATLHAVLPLYTPRADRRKMLSSATFLRCAPFNDTVGR